MKANWWSKRIMAASVGMSLLFTGNTMAAQGDAAGPEETIPTAPPQTMAPVETTAPEPTENRQKYLACAEIGAAADGKQIFVYDVERGEMVYCSVEETESLYPASITKLYSALVGLMYLDPETVVTAGNELKLMQPGSSRAYVTKGCKLTVEMLVQAMLIPSGNDASYVLAAAAGRAIAGDEKLDAYTAVEVFLEEMNRMGKELGLVNSHFCNPDGYHNESHFTCPADAARIGALALENEVIAKYINMQQDSVTFASGEHIAWYNTNHLINPESPYYVPFAVGMKTGYTDEAGHCLLAAFRDGHQKIIVGIFGAEKTYQRYADAAALFEACAVG